MSAGGVIPPRQVATHAGGDSAPDPAASVHPLKLASSAMLIAAAGLLVGALLSPWWTISYTFSSSSQTESGTILFLPGDTARVTVNGLPSSPTYVSMGFPETASLFATLELSLIVVGVITGIAGVLAVFGAVARARREALYGAVWIFGIAALIGSLLTVSIFPLAAPHALSNGFCGGTSSPATPCGSFQGNSWSAGTHFVWGAALGWILAIGAMVLSGVALAVWAAAVRFGVPKAAAKGVPA